MIHHSDRRLQGFAPLGRDQSSQRLRIEATVLKAQAAVPFSISKMSKISFLRLSVWHRVGCQLQGLTEMKRSFTLVAFCRISSTCNTFELFSSQSTAKCTWLGKAPAAFMAVFTCRRLSTNRLNTCHERVENRSKRPPRPAVRCLPRPCRPEKSWRAAEPSRLVCQNVFFLQASQSLAAFSSIRIYSILFHFNRFHSIPQPR